MTRTTNSLVLVLVALGFGAFAPAATAPVATADTQAPVSPPAGLVEERMLPADSVPVGQPRLESEDQRNREAINERRRLVRRNDVGFYDEIYRIGPSDVLEVNVWGEPELSRVSMQVRRDGRITLPLVEDIMIAGLTPEKAAAHIEKQLQAYVLDPQVTVIVREFNSSSYYLFGEVTLPGEYPLVRETTVLDTVIRAGGFRQTERSGQVIETGDLSRILLFRDRGDGSYETYQLDLSNYKDEGFATGNSRLSDMIVRPRDRIFVPERARIAYVLGEVLSPGIVPLAERTTLLQAIAERGGETPDADLRKIWIVHTSGENPEFRSFDLKSVLKKGELSENVVLETGDVVYVPKSIIGTLREFVRLWSETLQPAMSTYTQAWDTYYTKRRYDALLDSDFGTRRQEILREVERDGGDRDF